MKHSKQPLKFQKIMNLIKIPHLSLDETKIKEKNGAKFTDENQIKVITSTKKNIELNQQE